MNTFFMKSNVVRGRFFNTLLSRCMVSLFLVLLFAFPTFSGAISKDKRLAGNGVSSPSLGAPALTASKIQQALSAMKTGKIAASSSVAFSRDEKTGIPIFMDRTAIAQLSGLTGKTAQGATPAETALNFIRINSDVFQLDDPANELTVISVENTADGRSHVVFAQQYQGYPVWGKRLTIHFDADGAIYAMNGRYAPTPKGVNLADITLSKADALARVNSDLSQKTAIVSTGDIQKYASAYSGPEAQLVIRKETDSDTPLLVWHVVIRPNLKEEWQYFMDARDGSIVESYNAVPDQSMVSATAKDALGISRTFQVLNDGATYTLESTDTNIMTYDAHGKVVNTNSDVTLITSTNNTWADSIAVSAYWNGTQVYNYYLVMHNRKGLDGNNMETPMIVHYTPDGKAYDNAFWAGQYMAFGDAQPYAEALDVVAHEMTHGVTQYTVGLDYRYQPGALNEAISDVMACMMDSTNWTVGEVLPGGAIRDLENPTKYDLPADMDHYKSMSINTDNGGVHYNMSIPSRAFALLGDSIGRDKTAQILYRVLNSLYITPQSQFVDMRLGAVQASTDLFGADSQETAAVKTSFDTVGILNGSATTPAADTTPVAGGQWIAFLDGNSLKVARPDISASEDILTLSMSGLYTNSGRPMTASRDGKLIIFVDRRNNLRSIDLTTNQESLLDNQGGWSSVALSPDGSLLAATSTYADTSIYIFNLKNSLKSKQIHLYTPTTEDVKSQTMLYADALDWDQTGTQVLFDAYNNLPSEGSTATEFWDINLLDVENEIITRVKTPTENGYQVGNPSYAETNDRYIVCDLFSTTANYNAVVSFDLFTLNQVELQKTGFVDYSSGSSPNVGIPRYSPDDGEVVFQQYDSNTQTFTLSMIPLASDKMTPTGSSTVYHSGEIPIWFVQETTTVVEDTPASPRAFTLGQNFPNPFNPSTAIPFTLTRADRVVLTVHNILGQEVARLADGAFSAGSYVMRFDSGKLASGTYLYRLQTGSAVETRKMQVVK